MSDDPIDDKSTFTVPDISNGNRERRERRLRRISVAMVSLIVLAALGGLLGVRTTTASTSVDDFTLTVESARVARAGLATPLSIRVASDAGSLPSSVTLRIDSRYLAMLDEHGLSPEPASDVAGPRWTWWTFELPEGTPALQVDFDSRVEPSVQWRREGSVALFVDGDLKAQIPLSTWIAP